LTGTPADQQDAAPAVVLDFLRACPVLAGIPDAGLAGLARALRLHYHRAEESLAIGSDLLLIRSGAIEVRDDTDALQARLGEHEHLFEAVLAPQARIAVVEDALIFRLDAAPLQRIRARYPALDAGLRRNVTRRLRRASRRAAVPPLFASVASAMRTDLLCVTPADTVQDVAAQMAGRRVSSALVVESGGLCGILTDRDLRTRVVAVGATSLLPVAAAMTAVPQTIQSAAPLFDALLQMARSGYHHLPVLDGNRLCGIITATDLLKLRHDDPVYLIADIRRQDSSDAIAAIAAELPVLLQRWVASGMRAFQVSAVLGAFSDAITQRLLALAQLQLGAAPLRYAWLAFGSQARHEQLLGADQDNGLLLERDPNADEAAWFARLGETVCADLARCGYPRCPGNVMASNPDWRRSSRGWQTLVEAWLRAPTAEALLRSSIFFDLRCISGDDALLAALQEQVLLQSRDSGIFLATLTANALEQPPPLGLFRRFVVERSGVHRATLDLKRQGTLPLVDLVRIHALGHGIAAIGTVARIKALRSIGALNLANARNLEDAFNLIQQTRVEQQAAQLAHGEALDNHLDPQRLPLLAREQLRDAFGIVHDAQQTLRQTWRAGLP